MHVTRINSCNKADEKTAERNFISKTPEQEPPPPKQHNQISIISFPSIIRPAAAARIPFKLAPHQAPSYEPSKPARMDTAQTKALAIDHMNKNHHDALTLYLRAFNNVPTAESETARLETYTNHDLVIGTNESRYTIPLSPALKGETASELRSRAVSLYKESRIRLGLSPIVIKTYTPPQGIVQRVSFGACLLTFVVFCRKGNLDALRIPAPFLYDIRPYLFWGMVGVHGMEVGFFSFMRLARHGVRPFSAVWLAWLCSVFVEGVGAWVRFDGMVNIEKERAHVKKA